MMKKVSKSKIKFCANGEVKFVGFKPEIKIIKQNKKGEYVLKYETEK